MLILIWIFLGTGQIVPSILNLFWIIPSSSKIQTWNLQVGCDDAWEPKRKYGNWLMSPSLKLISSQQKMDPGCNIIIIFPAWCLFFCTYVQVQPFFFPFQPLVSPGVGSNVTVSNRWLEIDGSIPKLMGAAGWDVFYWRNNPSKTTTGPRMAGYPNLCFLLI